MRFGKKCSFFICFGRCFCGAFLNLFFMKKLDINPADVSVDLHIEYRIQGKDETHSFKRDVFLEDAMRILNLFMINPALNLDYFSIENFTYVPQKN